MAALIRKKTKSDHDRDEIPPGILYLLILKTFAVGGRLHGFEVAEPIQSRSDEVLQVEEGSLYPAPERMLIYYTMPLMARSDSASRYPSSQRVIGAISRIIQGA